MGGIVSSFSFRAFKIDALSLSMKQNLGTLEMPPSSTNDWELNLNVRQPVFFSKQKIYVVGVDCAVSLFPKDTTEKSDANALVTLRIGGVGSFGVQGERFPDEQEKNIVRAQFPALIFSHIRATATSILAGAGYGSVLLPLVNMHEAAKQSLGTVEINVIDL